MLSPAHGKIMSDVKKYPKKLPNKGTVMVDEQIARWRKAWRKREKEGQVLGKNRAAQLRKNAKDNARNKDNRELKTGTKKFF
jgi:hypothetical protein